MNSIIAPIAVEIIFIFSLKIKMIATESGKMDSKNARAIRFYTKKINSGGQIYIYCTKVKTLNVIKYD
jgi:hypothetical protein